MAGWIETIKIPKKTHEHQDIFITWLKRLV